MKAPAVLDSERLTIEPLAWVEAERLRTMLVREQVRRFLLDDEVPTPAEFQAVLAPMLAHGHRGLGLWWLRRRATTDDEPCGVVGLHPVRPTEAAERTDLANAIQVLVALAPEAWGRGYAAEALRRLVDHGFDDLGLSELVALVDEPNQRSQRLMHSLGFRTDGHVAGGLHPLAVWRLPAPAVSKHRRPALD